MLRKSSGTHTFRAAGPPSRRQRCLARHDARCAPPSGLHRLRNEQRGAWPSGGPAVAAVFKMEQEHARRARQCSARCIRDRSPVMPASPITFRRSRGSPTKPRRKSVPRHGCVISRSCCSPSMIALHSTIHCRARSSADRFHAVVPAPPSNKSSSLLDCQTAFQQVATDCVRLVQRHRKAAIAGDPSAIHKMRIELTKLRAMVRFFSPMMNDEAWPRLKKELRWLNSSLGKARDHDVTMNYAQRKRYRSWAKAVARSLARAMEKNHRTLAKKLGSDRYEELILALKHWIAAGPWLSNRLPFRSARLEVFSSARLRDWSAAISRKGRKLGALRRQQLHRVRIRAKHYRYCIDALQELGINIKPANLAFCETAKQMHRALGDLRDLNRLRLVRRGRPPGYRERKKRLLQRAEKPFRRQQNPSH